MILTKSYIKQITNPFHFFLNLVSGEIGAEMLWAYGLEVLDIVFVGSSQQKVALVSQVFEPTTVDELDHVPNRAEVNVLDVDLVALALPHVVLEHRSEHRRPGAQDGL